MWHYKHYGKVVHDATLALTENTWGNITVMIGMLKHLMLFVKEK